MVELSDGCSILDARKTEQKESNAAGAGNALSIQNGYT